MLGPNGTLQQIGTYHELNSSTGYIQDLVHKMSAKLPEPGTSSPRRGLEQHQDLSVEISRTDTVKKDIHEKFSSVSFYISSMGWMKFFVFVSLVTVEVVMNAMQSKSELTFITRNINVLCTTEQLIP